MFLSQGGHRKGGIQSLDTGASTQTSLTPLGLPPTKVSSGCMTFTLAALAAVVTSGASVTQVKGDLLELALVHLDGMHIRGRCELVRIVNTALKPLSRARSTYDPICSRPRSLVLVSLRQERTIELVLGSLE
jgi:hypothetical protein